jgi:RNA 2',3'-cyclic 3'-phosphodiesterase
MQRRIFIGIGLEDNVKNKLSKVIEKWNELPVKWSSADNLHITLLFLGFINDEELVKICENLNRAVEDVRSFYLEMKEIKLSPDARNPKMIWYSGEASQELKELHEKIEKSLDVYQVSKKTFSPHVTLGRIKAGKWKLQENIPMIGEEMGLVVPVVEICVFESIFENGKRKYEIIESYPLE